MAENSAARARKTSPLLSFFGSFLFASLHGEKSFFCHHLVGVLDFPAFLNFLNTKYSQFLLYRSAVKSERHFCGSFAAGHFEHISLLRRRTYVRHIFSRREKERKRENGARCQISEARKQKGRLGDYKWGGGMSMPRTFRRRVYVEQGETGDNTFLCVGPRCFGQAA